METGDSPPAGRLLVVSTPIGNLGDLSPRAREALATADLVAAEDTRRTGTLLRALGIEVPELLSCHRFNEAARIEGILARLRSGATVALVTDGGTPAISDPGWRLVAAAHAAGVRVSPVPGSPPTVSSSPASFPPGPPPGAGPSRTSPGYGRRWSSTRRPTVSPPASPTWRRCSGPTAPPCSAAN